MLYKLLNQQNPCFRPSIANAIDLLYAGGHRIMANAGLFIPKKPEEPEQVYQERLSWSFYHNHFMEIAGDYFSTLFSKSVKVVPAIDDAQVETADNISQSPFYEEFAKDADLCEHSFEEVLKQVAIEGIKSQYAYLGLDTPVTGDLDQAFLNKEMAEISVADEEEFNLSRVYCYHIPYACIIDWEYDDFGKFKWCMLKNIDTTRKFIEQERSTKVITFKQWYFNASGSVCYREWERIYKIDEEPKEEDDFPQSVPETKVDFKRIPIKVMCVPDGLWMGNHLMPMLIENFKLRSLKNFGQSRAANEIPFYQIGSAFNEDGSARMPEVEQGKTFKRNMEAKGALVGDEHDKFTFVGPKGEVFTKLDEQIKDNINEIHRIFHVMAGTIASKGTSSDKHKSGVASQSDDDNMVKCLVQYAILIKNFAKEVYDDISDARGEEITWHTLGMSDFSKIDRADIIAEAVQLDKINIPSKTFKKTYLQDRASMLVPNVEPTIMIMIRDEIDQAVDQMSDQQILQPDGYQRDQQSAMDSKVQNANRNELLKPSVKGLPPSSDMSSDETMPLGPFGHPQLPEGSHLQTGEHIPARTVFDHLAKDYRDKDIEFVKNMPWTGPVSVPLSSIDSSNMHNWAAAQPEEQDHVDMFAQMLSEGNQDIKPIVLVNNLANDNKYKILDGHHRFLGALKAGVPVPAYIGHVTEDNGPWDKLHAKQVDGKEESKQTSKQINETSQQKEVSNQADKSAMAKGGKTK